MPRVEDFFGDPVVSLEHNVRGAHYALNQDIVTAPGLNSYLAVSKPVSNRIISSLADDGLITLDWLATRNQQKARGRVINLYNPTEKLSEQIALYNHFQANNLSSDLNLDLESLEELSLETFATARTLKLGKKALGLEVLSEATGLHAETVRHLALHAVLVANETY